MRAICFHIRLQLEPPEIAPFASTSFWGLRHHVHLGLLTSLLTDVMPSTFVFWNFPPSHGAAS